MIHIPNFKRMVLNRYKYRLEMYLFLNLILFTDTLQLLTTADMMCHKRLPKCIYIMDFLFSPLPFLFLFSELHYLFFSIKYRFLKLRLFSRF